MPRYSIDDLGPPPREYRPQRARPYRGKAFETVEETVSRDELKVFKLSTVQLDCPENTSKARDLAARLSPDLPDIPATLASSRYMREKRINTCGAIWKLVKESKLMVRAFTLVPNDLVIAAGDLDLVDPSVLTTALRQCMYRFGAKDADGWLIAFLDGEFDPATGHYQLHFHGIAAGGMLDVLHLLQQKSKYRSRRYSSQHRVSAFQQLQIKRLPMHHQPYGITYCLKSYWAARSSNVGKNGEIGERVLGQRRKTRIPEPHHTEVLLWLDHWRLQDITLMVHLSVILKGLTPAR